MKHQFIISEEQLRQHVSDLLRWSAEKKLQPAELAMVLKIASGFLASELGITAEMTEHEIQ